MGMYTSHARLRREPRSHRPSQEHAGHVTLGNNTVIGGAAVFHQFIHIGDYALAQGISGTGTPFSLITDPEILSPFKRTHLMSVVSPLEILMSLTHPGA